MKIDIECFSALQNIDDNYRLSAFLRGGVGEGCHMGITVYSIFIV